MKIEIMLNLQNVDLEMRALELDPFFLLFSWVKILA